MTDHEVAREFDASGLRCPMPVLKTKKEEILEMREEGDKIIWFIKRSA
jgi:TusA-related sulfurtransferase